MKTGLDRGWRACGAALLLGGGLAWGSSADENWPAWRGPLANGVAPHGDPPVEWSESKNLRWKVPVPGRGTSTPVVWGDQVFILTAVPVGVETETPAGGEASPSGGFAGMVETTGQTQRFAVFSYDRRDGRRAWETTVRQRVPHAGHHRDHGYASASPVTDGEHLYAYFGSYGLYALDLKGRVVWEKDFGVLQSRNSFGEGTSPALYGDTLVIVRDHEGEDFIVALDKRDGRELWRQARDEATGWSTPLIVEQDGRWQVIVNATKRSRAYDLATGKPLWECGGQTANAIPSPVSAGGVVYLTSGFRGSTLQAIRLGGEGDLTGTPSILWSHSRGTPYVPSPLLYGGLLYFVAGNEATLSVAEADTGRLRVEAERIQGMFGMYASPVGAADRVYLVGRDGSAAVLKKAPTLEVLARNKLDDGFDASPAVVGKDLLLRGRANLYCVSAE